MFGPFVHDAYLSERRHHDLLPEPAKPATPSPTPSPPPKCVTPAPSLPGYAAEGLNPANVKRRRGPEETTTGNRLMHYHSLAVGASPGATDRPRGWRTRRGISSRDGGRGAAGKYAGGVIVTIPAERNHDPNLRPDALWSCYQIRLTLRMPVGILVSRLDDTRRVLQS